jgi:hypothetical protein
MIVSFESLTVQNERPDLNSTTVLRCAFQYIFNNDGMSHLILGLVLQLYF